MKITGIRIWHVRPPHDAWLFLSIETDAGLTGWGECTGGGSDAAVVAICREAAEQLLGGDPLDLDALLAPVRAFRYPPPAGKIVFVAWSAVAQALWDIRGQAFGQPLCRLLGGTPKPVRLYANLNRGLFRDRSPEAHARHAAEALKEGFAAAKCTPFDGVVPSVPDEETLAAPMERLRRIVDAVGGERIAVDCHCRFSPGLARRFLERLGGMGRFAWIEDILSPCHGDLMPELRMAFPGIIWGSGEETYSLAMAAELLSGRGKPDIFMPDVKFICGPDEFAAVVRLASSAGCLMYPHNPSGPISLAFSAHMAALTPGGMVEYPFKAVPDQKNLCLPPEPVDNGWYHLGDKPGLGVAPSGKCLDEFGSVLLDAKK